MKNYIEEIIKAFAHNDYSDEINHKVWQWMTNNEHVSEKEEALHQLWEEAHYCGNLTGWMFLFVICIVKQA